MKTLNFKYIKDIIWYDGPLLSLGVTEENIPVLEIWCDTTDDRKTNTYAYAYINDIRAFILGEKSYYVTLQESKKIITFKHNSEGEFDFKEVEIENYLNMYGPQVDSSLEEDLVDIRQELLKNTKL